MVWCGSSHPGALDVLSNPTSSHPVFHVTAGIKFNQHQHLSTFWSIGAVLFEDRIEPLASWPWTRFNKMRSPIVLEP